MTHYSRSLFIFRHISQITRVSIKLAQVPLHFFERRLFCLKIPDKPLLIAQNQLEPFFKLNFDCHSRDIACDPEGGRSQQYLQYIWA